MKKLVLIVLALVMICLPAMAAKDARGAKMPIVSSNQVQIAQYPVVPCAITVPADWETDIDDNDVMFAGGGDLAIMVWANPKAVPFDSLAQLDDSGKAAFSRQMQREAAEGKKNFKLEKAGFTTMNNLAIYNLECSYVDPETNKETYNRTIYVVKAKRLLAISGFSPYVLANISTMNKLMDQVGF